MVPVERVGPAHPHARIASGGAREVLERDHERLTIRVGHGERNDAARRRTQDRLETGCIDLRCVRNDQSVSRVWSYASTRTQSAGSDPSQHVPPARHHFRLTHAPSARGHTAELLLVVRGAGEIGRVRVLSVGAVSRRRDVAARVTVNSE